jgi:tetratricopeptide (TPR) repeat protein
MLEPQVFRFRQNADYYYILGTAYLHTGDISGASTYLKRVVHLKPQDVSALLSLAAIYVKQNMTQKAIEIWLDVLQIDGGNRFARKGLNLLKESADNPELLNSFVNSQKFYQLIPEKGIKIYIPLLAGIVVIFVVPLILFLLPNVKERVESRPGREAEVSSLRIEKGEEIIGLSGEFTYVLTEKEIEEYLDEAKERFDQFEDNRAQVIINRLKYSNASRAVKEKANMIESYLSVPTFLNFKTNYTYREVADEPLLYENCHVRWKGKVSNVNITEEEITCDLLIGYQDNRVVEGIVPVVFDFALSIEPGQAVELIGRVELTGDRFMLQGVSMRRIAENE